MRDARPYDASILLRAEFGMLRVRSRRRSVGVAQRAAARVTYAFARAPSTNSRTIALNSRFSASPGTVSQRSMAARYR